MINLQYERFTVSTGNVLRRQKPHVYKLDIVTCISDIFWIKNSALSIITWTYVDQRVRRFFKTAKFDYLFE